MRCIPLILYLMYLSSTTSNVLRDASLQHNTTLSILRNTLSPRKKFFFSDQNVSTDNPRQLNLIYVRSHDAVVDCTHPCTMEESIQFGARPCETQTCIHWRRVRCIDVLWSVCLYATVLPLFACGDVYLKTVSVSV